MNCFACILSACFIVGVHATSSGMGIFICDARDPNLGCTNFDRKTDKCTDSGRIMNWAKVPVGTADITLRTADGKPADDPKTYVPGETLTLHIRVIPLHMKWRGILMYAEDANKKRTGKWLLDDNDWVHDQGCGGSVLHGSADLKPFHTTFHWKADSTTKGPVTFRCLLKRGPANVGEFYWPNNGNDLVLKQETSPPKRQLWVRGGKGQSCDSVCKASGKQCNEDAFTKQTGVTQNTQSTTLRKAAFMAGVLCDSVTFSSCSSIAPTTTKSVGMPDQCWYKDTRCNQQQRSTSQTICSRSSNTDNGFRLCPCGCGGNACKTNTPSKGPSTTSAASSGLQITWENIGFTTECDTSAGEVILAESPGKGSDLAACKKACEDDAGCKSITFFSTGWCSHFSTECRKTKSNKKAMISIRLSRKEAAKTTASPTTSAASSGLQITWENIGFTTECDTSAGEVYRKDQSPGKGSDLAACKKACEDVTWCKSITFFITGWCSHFSTECRNTKSNKEAMVSMRLSRKEASVIEVERRETVDTDAGTRLTTPLFTTAMAALALTGRQGRLAMVAALWGMLGMADAHNWVHSGSRANGFASTWAPCGARQPDDKPHVQVGFKEGVTDKFQVEWATGHQGRKTYLVVIHSSDLPKLKGIRDSDMDAYIEECGAAGAFKNTIENEKMHRVPKGHTGLSADDNANYFEAKVGSGDAGYRLRPAMFKETTIKGMEGDTDLYRYKADERKDDKRAECKSSKFDWMIQVHRFRHERHMPKELDTAYLSFPPRRGAGHYIVYYHWSGYRDCVDVDVTSQSTVAEASRYGVMNADAEVFERIDHCAFEYAQMCKHFAEVIDTETLAACQNKCSNEGPGKCDGVMLQPLKFPDERMNAYRGLHENVRAPAQIKNHVTWSCRDVFAVAKKAGQDKKITVDVDKLLTRANEIGKTPMFCYTVKSRKRQDEVFRKYQISLDPDSPTFYSTCYLRKKVVNFGVKSQWWASNANANVNTAISQPWKFEDQCISCKDRASEYRHPVPKWRLSDTCVNCDTEGDNYSPPDKPFKTALVFSKTWCDGRNEKNLWVNPLPCNAKTPKEATEKCFKRPFAFRDASAGVKRPQWTIADLTKVETCSYLTYRDPECSDTFWFAEGGIHCWCVKKESCCGGCLPVHTSGNKRRWGSVYDINSTPDPNCSRGNKAEESGRTGCCKGTDKCDVVEIPDQRLCKDNGPPCWMS